MRPNPERRLDLEAAVEAVVRAPINEVLEMHREPVVYDAFLAGREVVRVAGIAGTEGDPVEWAFIEKVTEGPAVASAYLYDNGAREFAAYRSPVLHDLAPGVAVPRLLGSAQSTDGRLTLWLEELGRTSRSEVALITAARHLGALGGRWLGRVPDEPWLFDGWIDRHRQPNALRNGMAVLAAARGRPPIEDRLGGRLGEAIALVEEQERLPSLLENLPQTLCHHDAVAANVFHRDRDGTAESVLIDWESVGPGPIGADLASLLFSSARRGEISGRAVADLLPRALDAYADGIADSGASVERNEIELGLHASIALRWTLVRDVIRALEGSAPVRRGSAPHESTAEAVDELLALISVLLDSAARTLELTNARSS